jgi:trans-aconitate methyltransferase
MAARAPRNSEEWNAQAYHRLDRPQQAWARSVLDTIALRGDETVLDAGCGTAKLAAVIARRVPRGRVLAVDRSANMLRVAHRALAAPEAPRVTLIRASLEALPFAGSVDVVISTAAFHWVLEHDRLFRELYVALRPGGRLVAQCGGGPNLARVLARAERVLAGDPYRPHFEGWSGPWMFADAGSTAARLRRAGFVEVHTSLAEAPTVLADREEYVAFLESVVLRAHCDRLADAAAADDPPFSLDYWRLNMRAQRPSGPPGDG